MATSGRLLLALLLAGILALPLLLYLPLLSEPFERDEGVYATVARGLLDGQLPYRDLFDHKPPLIYGWYALSFVLFGESVEAPRLLASIVLSATTLLVYVVARLLASRPAAYVAAALFALSTGFTLLRPNANTEVFMLLPLTASLVCATFALRKRTFDGGMLAWCLTAGVLAGLAAMTRPVAIWNLAALTALLALWAFRGERRGRDRRLLPALMLLAGSAVAGVVVAAPWIAAGALDDFVYANVRFNALYGAQFGLGDKLRLLQDGVLRFVIVAAPLVAVAWMGLFALRGRWSWPLAPVLVIWAAASAAAVASPGRFYPHYFVQLLPALALLALPLVERAREDGWLGNAPRAGVLALGALAVVALALPASLNVAVYLEPTAAARHEAKYPLAQGIEQALGPELGAYLAARSEPGETIYDYGRDSQLYFYADRAPAARFFYDRPFWLDPPTFEETIAVLRAAPPVYIVDTARVSQPLPALGVTAELNGRYYPQPLADLLAGRYRYEGVVLYAGVYRLIEP